MSEKGKETSWKKREKCWLPAFPLTLYVFCTAKAYCDRSTGNQMQHSCCHDLYRVINTFPLKTLPQMTYFRLFQIKRDCRQQF